MKNKGFHFDLPEKVNIVLEILENAGFEAYIVGGCVRDLILDIEPNDFDITTNALPEDVKKLFDRTVDTGIEHGTVSVLMEEDVFEITTYRIDGDYKDARHPEEVSFTRNLADDLLRRDFTINAMAYNKGGLIDIFDGISDLKKGIIKGVGIADARFKEDALRMLRAIRFSARFGYEIEPETKRAILDNAKLISKVSVERIKIEIDKIFLSTNPDYFECLERYGLLEYISRDLNEIFKNDSQKRYSIGLLKNSKKDISLCWAGVLFFMPKAIAKHTMKSLNFDNKTMRKVLFILDNKAENLPLSSLDMRKAMANMGGMLPYFLDFKESQAILDNNNENINKTSESKRLHLESLEKRYPTKIADLKIGGNDLIELGYKGVEIGAQLARLLEIVLENPEMNEREFLYGKSKK